MKHSSDGGVLKGAHEYKNGTYQEVKDFKPTEYPKHVQGKDGRVVEVKNAQEEAEKAAPKPAPEVA
jgi:hypothetical protein